MTLLHRGDMHVIDLSKLSPFAKLFKSGLQGGPYFSTEGRETRLTFKTLEDVTLDNCLAFARAYPDPPFDYFNPRPIDSTFTVLEKCRTCGKLENEESKLFRCSKCSTERRSRSALYCSKDCQRADWKARHKEEHAGVREWDLGATIDVT
ncbi:hypothetical protein Moror_8376 [Moniliophthora roreri MCA 2997]|uniref:MYND-type domain-containing protein n=1 Tax=Moniliophthora roreri (strain MCA 2997) TaxID=1381753 RepID=V2XMX4_MONRO|nr:hypothetical protein Moror_8376 [Moniliophthora roreri MCA 2997]